MCLARRLKQAVTPVRRVIGLDGVIDNAAAVFPTKLQIRSYDVIKTKMYKL